MGQRIQMYHLAVGDSGQFTSGANNTSSFSGSGTLNGDTGALIAPGLANIGTLNLTNSSTVSATIASSGAHINLLQETGAGGTYTFNNNIFTNNTALATGSVSNFNSGNNTLGTITGAGTMNFANGSTLNYANIGTQWHTCNGNQREYGWRSDL